MNSKQISIAIQTTEFSPRKTAQSIMTPPSTPENISSQQESKARTSTSSSSTDDSKVGMLPENYIKFLSINEREPIWEHDVDQWIDIVTTDFKYFGIQDPEFKLRYLIQSFTTEQYAKMKEFMPDRDIPVTKKDYDDFLNAIKEMFELSFIEQIEALGLGPKCKKMTPTQIYSLICRNLDFYTVNNKIPEQILGFYFVRLVPESVAIYVRRLLARSGTKLSMSKIVEMAENFWDIKCALDAANDPQTKPHSDTEAYAELSAEMKKMRLEIQQLKSQLDKLLEEK